MAEKQGLKQRARVYSIKRQQETVFAMNHFSFLCFVSFSLSLFCFCFGKRGENKIKSKCKKKKKKERQKQSKANTSKEARIFPIGEKKNTTQDKDHLRPPPPPPRKRGKKGGGGGNEESATTKSITNALLI